jgi:hypothetical protein
MTRSGQHGAARIDQAAGAYDSEPTIMERLKKPLMIFGAALVVIIADVILGKVLDAPVSLGPVRLRYIGAGIAVIALVTGFLSLLSED